MMVGGASKSMVAQGTPGFGASMVLPSSASSSASLLQPVPGAMSRVPRSTGISWPHRDGCAHLAQFKTDASNIAALRSILQWASVASMPLAKSKTIPMVQCTGCNCPSSRVHACLHCVFLGCWTVTEGHMRKHLNDHPKHFLALDLRRSQIYCARCGDYVYDSDIELIIRQHHRRSYEDLLSCRESNDNSNRAKRTRLQLWHPTPTELDTLRTNGVIKKCTGLRGLNNLGSTCFMNTILQSFIHNPLIRGYFLADRHGSRNCTFTNKLEGQTTCLSCHLDELFTECYSGNSTPFSPHQFLHSVWLHSRELAGYEQQDAHEFFITVLNSIHSCCNGTASDCQCIIHQIFKGELRSDVTCLTCGNISTAYDPIFDISVDIHQNTDTASSLLDCLKRFTQPERLGSSDVYCKHCSDYTASTKQLSIWSAPCVLTVHLKRFERKTGGSTKVDVYSHFPMKLDVSPFLSANLCFADPVLYTPDVQLPFALTVGHEFSLFAVITHTGTMDTGHYIIYVLSKAQWFKIDDDKITLVDSSEVSATHAYMLFYVKRQLEYA